jgi:Protein of unknown function (DUF3558)
MPRRPRTIAILGVGLGVALLLQACASSTEGTASPADPSSPSVTSRSATSSTPAANGPSLADLDPCELLRPQEVTELGLPPEGQPDTLAGHPVCFWEEPNANLGIYIHPDRGLADLNTNRATRVEDKTIGRHDARLLVKADGCDVDLAVTEHSTVTIVVLMFDNPSAGCSVAERAAALVEPRLPGSRG